MPSRSAFSSTFLHCARIVGFDDDDDDDKGEDDVEDARRSMNCATNHEPAIKRIIFESVSPDMTKVTTTSYAAGYCALR